MEGGLLLDVVVGECSAILELLAGKDETLLVGWDALLVLDLGLDGVDGVGGLDLEGDGLAREGLDEAASGRRGRAISEKDGAVKACSNVHLHCSGGRCWRGGRGNECKESVPGIPSIECPPRSPLSPFLPRFPLLCHGYCPPPFLPTASELCCIHLLNE